MSKSKIFIWLAVSFAIGVFLASVIVIRKDIIYLVLGLSTAVFGLTISSKKKWVALGGAFLFVAALGVVRLQAAQVPNEYNSYFGTKQRLEGYIVEDADVRTNNQLLTIRPINFRQNILVTVPLGRDYFYGDWVVVEGKITQAQSFDDFDYEKYLERFNTYALVRYPEVWVLKSHQLSWIKEHVLRVKAAFVARSGRLLPEPQRSLLLGILIGAKKTLPPEVVDNFNATGTSHIIAISGFNISIIITSLSFLAYVVGRRVSFWLSLVVIISFVILSGASASVIRAALMGTLLLMSFNIGRQYAVGPSLFFAALVMLVLNPKILFWDVGFQLSFLATAGIIYIVPLVEEVTERWPNPLHIKSMVVVTLAAIASTLPLILFQFGRLSIIAPVANILIVPFVPLTMLVGFLTVLPIVGPGFAFLANLALLYMLRVVAILASIPYSSLDLHIARWMFLALIGLVIVLFGGLKYSVGRLRKSRKRGDREMTRLESESIWGGQK